MLTTEFSETKKAWIDGYQQANYWKTRHAKAIEREAVWRAKVQELEETLRQQLRNYNDQIKELIQQHNKINHDQDKRIKKLEERVEELKAQNSWLKQRLFGRQTEQIKDSEKMILMKIIQYFLIARIKMTAGKNVHAVNRQTPLDMDEETAKIPRISM